MNVIFGSLREGILFTYIRRKESRLSEVRSSCKLPLPYLDQRPWRKYIVARETQRVKDIP